VTEPIAAQLRADERNSGFRIVGRTNSIVDHSSLVLDLERVSRASSADLFRGFIQAARAMHERHKTFDSVTLSCAGKPVYRIDGELFDRIGAEYADGENPLYLLRTLPEKLARPDGTRAFDAWEGGVLGVVSRQMSDLKIAGERWANGD
jgi:hypothetical protein